MPCKRATKHHDAPKSPRGSTTAKPTATKRSWGENQKDGFLGHLHPPATQPVEQQQSDFFRTGRNNLVIWQTQDVLGGQGSPWFVPKWSLDVPIQWPIFEFESRMGKTTITSWERISITMDHGYIAKNGPSILLLTKPAFARPKLINLAFLSKTNHSRNRQVPSAHKASCYTCYLVSALMTRLPPFCWQTSKLRRSFHPESRFLTNNLE